MSEINPLVQRVDALLKRHQQQIAGAHAEPPSHAAEVSEPLPDAPTVEATPDDDIPVLTEIVESTAIPAAAVEPWDDALAAKIETAVLEKVLAGLEGVLDQRLGRTVSDLLEQAMDGLRADLSASVRELVREAVAAAVRKELAERTLRD